MPQNRTEYLEMYKDWADKEMKRLREVVGDLEKEKREKKEVIVFLRGGLISHAVGNTNVDINIVDTDTDGSDPRELGKYEGRTAWVYEVGCRNNPEKLAKVKELIEENGCECDFDDDNPCAWCKSFEDGE